MSPVRDQWRGDRRALYLHGTSPPPRAVIRVNAVKKARESGKVGAGEGKALRRHLPGCRNSLTNLKNLLGVIILMPQIS